MEELTGTILGWVVWSGLMFGPIIYTVTLTTCTR